MWALWPSLSEHGEYTINTLQKILQRTFDRLRIRKIGARLQMEMKWTFIQSGEKNLLVFQSNLDMEFLNVMKYVLIHTLNFFVIGALLLKIYPFLFVFHSASHFNVILLCTMCGRMVSKWMMCNVQNVV